MTNQEAINVMEKYTDITMSKTVIEAHNMAVAALEKQISQNCKRIGATQLKCVCGAVIRLYKYCPYCGQKLE